MISAEKRALWREILLWSAPALAIGFFLRAWLMWSLPYGYIQFDSIDFLETPYYLISKHELVIQSKRSFLTPLTFTLPFLLHIPGLIAIPVAQHALGLVQIVFAGALVRFWFARWRWFIIPVTALVAISPWNLWFEHTLMGEAQYLFLLFAVALAGTLWAREPQPKWFALFWLTLFLAASSRGEGKLFLLFGIVLVPLVLWADRKRMWIHLAMSVVLALVLFKALRSPTNASTNLYASLIHMAPEHFAPEPGIEPYLAPVRDRVKAQNLPYPSDSVKVAKDIQDGVDDYMKKKMPKDSLKHQRRAGAKILNHLSRDILIANPVKVLVLPLVKFRLAVDGWMSGKFDDHFLKEKQKYALNRNDWVEGVLGKGLFGKNMTQEEVGAWIDEHEDPSRTGWMDKLSDGWNNAIIWVRTPDRRIEQKRWVHDYIQGIKLGRNGIPGIPLFYVIALAGMVTAAFCPHGLREAQLAWAISLLAAWYLVLTVGDVLPRYSVAYQPFCLIFFFAFFDWICARFVREKVAS